MISTNLKSIIKTYLLQNLNHVTHPFNYVFPVMSLVILLDKKNFLPIAEVSVWCTRLVDVTSIQTG